MELSRQYITDEDGKVTGVILNPATFRKIEEALLDEGLARAVEAADREETLDIVEARQWLRQNV